jgi:hypothetical protein
MLPDTGIDEVKKQRNAEYAKHINDPVLSSLKMEGIRFYLKQDTNCCSRHMGDRRINVTSFRNLIENYN